MMPHVHHDDASVTYYGSTCIGSGGIPGPLTLEFASPTPLTYVLFPTSTHHQLLGMDPDIESMHEADTGIDKDFNGQCGSIMVTLLFKEYDKATVDDVTSGMVRSVDPLFPQSSSVPYSTPPSRLHQS